MALPSYMTPEKKPSFGDAPEQPEMPGMDKQTKSIILFGIIFSILAVLVVLLFIFKPGQSVLNATVSTTTAPVSTSSTPTFLSSLFKFFAPGSVNPRNIAPVVPGSSKSQTSSQKQPSSASPKTSPTGAATNATTSEADYLSVGVYGNANVTKQQLDLINNHTVSSSLRGMLWISGVSRSSNSNSEFVTISTKSTLPADTNITGFILKSLVTGQTVEIGQAVVLPVANASNINQDILLDPGKKVYLVTGHSPLGYSFRLNICTGYFEQFQNFTPALPKNCPLLKDIPLPLPPNQLTDSCVSKISSWPRCTIPTSFANAGINDQTHDCQVFFQDNLGYQKCVDTHHSDSNFYSPAIWQVYLGRSAPIWKSSREIIWLTDADGRFISQYSY